ARLDDRVHRARFFAEAAVDALEEIDVIAGGAACAIGSHVRLDRDRKGRAHCFAQLAGDATLLAVRITTQGVQAAEAHRLWRLLFRVLHRDFLAEEMLTCNAQTLEQFPKRQRLDPVAYCSHITSPRGRRPRTPSRLPRRSTPASPGSALSSRGA